ncbi:MAG TPA: hypothetical protein VGF49_24110 [Candidatus Solibacter sp.]|jgi:hypothetical protein
MEHDADLANLAPVDSEGKLDLILRAYLSPIAGPHMITAAHAIRGGGMIGAAKPHLAQQIARRYLVWSAPVMPHPSVATLPSAMRCRPLARCVACRPTLAPSALSRAVK